LRHEVAPNPTEAERISVFVQLLLVLTGVRKSSWRRRGRRAARH
jgi:hypothetical protein